MDDESEKISNIGKFAKIASLILNPSAKLETHKESIVEMRIFARNMLTGGFAASVAVTVMAPVERIKLILQLQSSLPPKADRIPYKGFRDAIVRIPQEQGLFSFWRGNTASIFRAFPYQALNFAFREKYKTYFSHGFDTKKQLSSRILGNLLSGGIAGASSLALLYPIDFARTKMALDFGKTKQTRETPNIRSVIRTTIKQDGIKGIYRGLTFSLGGVFLYRAVYFGLYDTAKDLSPPHLKHNVGYALLLGEISATTAGIIAYPADTVRRSLMIEAGNETKRYSGALNCAREIYAKKGIPGFYRGGLVNVLRGSGGAITLVLYDEIHRKIWKRYFPLDNYKSKKSSTDTAPQTPVEEIVISKFCEPIPSQPQVESNPPSEETKSEEQVIERINHICDY